MNDSSGPNMERITPSDVKSKADYLLYLRHLFAYEFAARYVSKNDIVLEIGCGEGYGTSLISKEVNMMVSLDVDPKTLRKAREKYGSYCNFVLYNGVDLPIKSNKFDGVISFQVVEHVKNVPKYMSEVVRVLKEDGIFLCTTPNRVYRLKPGQKPWNPFHIREYYANELERILCNIFGEVNVVGICGNDEVQAIEIDRVKPRGIILRIYEMILLRVADNLPNKTCIDNFSRIYTTRDFYITNVAEDGIDLMAICKNNLQYLGNNPNTK